MIPLNNLDTLRSYGSAGDELENVPPDYRRNLNRSPQHKINNGQFKITIYVYYQINTSDLIIV